MKKTLLSLALVASFFGYSQDNVYFEDCSALTVGNIGTSLTGASAGQGGWYTTVPTAASPAGANSDFQIVDAAGVNGNSIQILGTTSAVAAGQTRAMYRGFNTEWTDRTGGNDVVQLEYDFYTGPATASLNTYRNYIFSSDNSIAMAGFYYAPATMEIRGWAQYDNAGTIGYYTFGLGDTANPNIILDPDTWYRIGVAYDYNTGDITWKDSAGLFYGGVTGANVGVDIDRVQFQISNAAGNAEAAQIRLDNINLSFHALEELLSVNNNNADAMKFLRVSPNPAKDVLTISNQDTTFNSIEVTDLNGRVVAATKPNAVETTQVNIADLSAGVYMVKIVSDKGTVTKKIIKN